MNRIESSKLDKSMRLVCKMHGINFYDDESIDYFRDGLVIMDTYYENIALHCIRVSNYSAAIGKFLGISDRGIKLLWCAAVFHDVGKKNIPIEILKKSTKLTGKEYEVIKHIPVKDMSMSE